MQISADLREKQKNRAAKTENEGRGGQGTALRDGGGRVAAEGGTGNKGEQGSGGKGEKGVAGVFNHTTKAWT